MKMNLPVKPPAWAIRISKLLQEIEKLTGEVMYPVRVKDIAADVSRQFFPDSPITKITGEDFSGGFEGMLRRIPNAKNEWGIVYNTAIKSPGRINFTLAHELGHYLLHRLDLENGVIQCKRQDMFRWNSEYGMPAIQESAALRGNTSMSTKRERFWQAEMGGLL